MRQNDLLAELIRAALKQAQETVEDVLSCEPSMMTATELSRLTLRLQGDCGNLRMLCNVRLMVG